MEITIKDTKVTLKQSFRTAMLYENITNESFGNNLNTSNFILYFYCNVLGSEPTLTIGFDDFIDFLDLNPNLLSEFTQWLIETNKVQDKLKGTTEEKTVKKKATKKSKKNE